MSSFSSHIQYMCSYLPPPLTVIIVCSAEAANCREAGWTRCCRKGDCLAPASQCFCDISCHMFGDCCDDITITCPKPGLPRDGIIEQQKLKITVYIN